MVGWKTNETRFILGIFIQFCLVGISTFGSLGIYRLYMGCSKNRGGWHSDSEAQLLPSLTLLDRTHGSTWVTHHRIRFFFQKNRMDVRWGLWRISWKIAVGGIKHHLQSLAFPLAQDGTLGAKANVATVSSAIDTCERRGSAVCFLVVPSLQPHVGSSVSCSFSEGV